MADRFTHPDYRGIALVIDGPATYTHTEFLPDGGENAYGEETGDWYSEEVPSDTDVIVHMVGDDRPIRVDRSDLVPIDDDGFCHGCGQTDCTADGREAS
jgi:hypothetical protein